MDEIENPAVAATPSEEDASAGANMNDDDEYARSTSYPLIETQLSNDFKLPESLFDDKSPSLLSLHDGVGQSNKSLISPSLDGTSMTRDSRNLSVRPGLRRENSTPRDSIPLSPALADIPDSPQDNPDSNTLADLKKIRESEAPAVGRDLPSLEHIYDFEYKDVQSFPVEIEEWFTYSTNEAARISSLVDSYHSLWASHNGIDSEHETLRWTDTSSDREHFIEAVVAELDREDDDPSLSSNLSCLCYLALGVYRETAGQEERQLYSNIFRQDNQKGHDDHYVKSGLQMKTMIENAIMMVRYGILENLLRILKTISSRDLSVMLRLPLFLSDYN